MGGNNNFTYTDTHYGTIIISNSTTANPTKTIPTTFIHTLGSVKGHA